VEICHGLSIMESARVGALSARMPMKLTKLALGAPPLVHAICALRFADPAGGRFVIVPAYFWAS
jgi:hypothetical protein